MAGLTQKQEQAIQALLSLGSLSDAAQAVQVSERTLRRWISQAPFQRALHQSRKQIFDSVIAKLAGLGVEATNTVASIMRNRKNTPATRLRAASEILGHMMQAHDQDLEQRLSEIEQALAGMEREEPA